MPAQPNRVLIAGSGVAAVEAVLALRHLAGRAFEIQLLAPEHALEHRAASVATPFGLGAPPPLDLRDLAARYGVALVEGELAAVDAAARRVRLVDGDERAYDLLLVTVGARPKPALAGSLSFRGPADVPAIERVLAEIETRHRRRVAVVVPPGAAWPLPAYELAVMMRTLTDAAVALVTAEREPLWIFGDAAGREFRALLADRRIDLHAGTRATRVTDDALVLESQRVVVADTVISLPRLVGPGIAGLPGDDHGFLPTDAHGWVAGVEHVLAAGDVTTFPVKQGGLATQQADAAAASIAHELGAAVEPQPFAPVLRGLLLTGGAPLYLRAELDPTALHRRPAGQVSSRALWWPPGKVAGRYLAPYLSTARPRSLGDGPLVDRIAGTARG